MGRIYISDIAKGKIKNAKIVKENKTDKYNKLVKEADERIKEEQKRLTKAYIDAQNYIAR